MGVKRTITVNQLVQRMLDRETDFRGIQVTKAKLWEHSSYGTLVVASHRYRGNELAQGLDFSGSNLHMFEAPGLVMDGFNFSNCQFHYACNFADSGLRNTNFRNAWLMKADLRGAVMDGTDFTEGRIDGANFRHAFVKGVDFTDAGLFVPENIETVQGIYTVTFRNTNMNQSSFVKIQERFVRDGKGRAWFDMRGDPDMEQRIYFTVTYPGE